MIYCLPPTVNLEYSNSMINLKQTKLKMKIPYYYLSRYCPLFAILILGVITVLSGPRLMAQPLISDQGLIDPTDTVFLHGYIHRDTTLQSGKLYVIQHNVKVNAQATLTIPANTKILFAPQTSLVVEGGLKIAGNPNALTNISSMNEADQGIGIIIRGTEGDDIDISYARFSRLLIPLELEVGWYRENVAINDNIFRDLATGEPNILISSPDYIRAFEEKPTSNLDFSRNSFFNNWGSIFVESFEDDRVQIDMKNNLLTNNVVYGIDKGVPSNTPLFGVYDGAGKQFQTNISENSLFGNYQINSATDSIIREISLGVQGEGDEFNLPGNFYRSKDIAYISSTFDHFYTNSGLPLLTPNPILAKPTEKAHAHIWRVIWDDEEVVEYQEIPPVRGQKLALEVLFNRSVRSVGPKQLEYVHFDTVNNTINVRPVAIYDTSWSADRTKFFFTLRNPSFLKNPLGYLVLSNFVDDEGFEVPEFTIGQLKAINNYSRLYQKGLARAFIPSIDVIRDRSKIQLSDEALETLQESIENSLTDIIDFEKAFGEYTSLAKTWELGVFAGLSNYLGDLAFQLVDQDHWHPGGGIWGQYNISEWFSVKLGYNMGRVSGSDYDHPNIERHRRLWSFRSDIHEIAATFEWHVSRYGVDRRVRIMPTVYGGIAYFHFNPKAQALLGWERVSEKWVWTEKWYALQPIGTEGQTVEGSIKTKYHKNSYSIPFGFQLDFDLHKKWIVGADIGFRWTFTDYLDDMGGFYYSGPGGWREDFIAIREANPDLEGEIIHTINNGDIHVAALLADPSLADTRRDGYPAADPHYDAKFNFPAQNNGRKGDGNDNDWYMFVGFSLSRVLGLRRAEELQQETEREKIQRIEEKNTKVVKETTVIDNRGKKKDKPAKDNQDKEKKDKKDKSKKKKE